jgi:hypothetical protein
MNGFRRITIILVFSALLLLPEAIAGESKLYVTSSAENAVVKINGKEVGKTGEIIRNLTPGAVVLTVEAEGFAPSRQEIIIEEKIINKCHVELKGVPINVDIVTEPDGATVYFDGKKQPENTPCTIKTVAGKHEIVILKDGYADEVFKDRVLKNGDVIEATLKKGKSTYVSPEEKAKLAEAEERARKGIYRCDFDTKELPEWLELKTTGEGEGKIEGESYVLKMPNQESTAVLQFKAKKGFPWLKPFSAKIRFRFTGFNTGFDLGILRLDNLRKAPRSIDGEDRKMGSFRWLVFFSPPRTPVQLVPFAIQPGGGWGSRQQAGFSLTVVGTLGAVKIGEFLSLELQSDGRNMTYVQYDEHDKPAAKHGPISLSHCRKKYSRSKYWLSFGDLNAKLTDGKIEIDYIEVVIPKKKRR